MIRAIGWPGSFLCWLVFQDGLMGSFPEYIPELYPGFIYPIYFPGIRR